jgi:hypothetical protein
MVVLVAGGMVPLARDARAGDARGVHRQPRGERGAADAGKRAQAGERLIVKHSARRGRELRSRHEGGSV